MMGHETAANLPHPLPATDHDSAPQWLNVIDEKENVTSTILVPRFTDPPKSDSVTKWKAPFHDRWKEEASNDRLHGLTGAKGIQVKGVELEELRLYAYGRLRAAWKDQVAAEKAKYDAEAASKKILKEQANRVNTRHGQVSCTIAFSGY